MATTSPSTASTSGPVTLMNKKLGFTAMLLSATGMGFVGTFTSWPSGV